MRGTGWLHSDWLGRIRITPAHAGNSTAPWCTSAGAEDHPRTCGEQALKPSNAGNAGGSPPHMRGTAAAIQRNTAERRITPAHAGNRTVALRLLPLGWDHPRTCGEQIFFALHCSIILGSPPHMRGTEPFSSFVMCT